MRGVLHSFLAVVLLLTGGTASTFAYAAASASRHMSSAAVPGLPGNPFHPIEESCLPPESRNGLLVAKNPINWVDPDGLAAIYTDQTSGVTYFNPNPEMPGPISSWPSRSEVLPSSKPGAAGPYESADVYPAEGPRNNKPRAYGPNDPLLTDDPRYRWLQWGWLRLAESTRAPPRLVSNAWVHSYAE